MNAIIFSIVIFCILLLLVFSRRKDGDRHRHGSHGAVKPKRFDYHKSRSARPYSEKNFNKEKEVFDAAAFWKSRDVQYRTENAPFIDPKRAVGLDAALADDEHGKFGEAATAATVARAANDDRRHHFILQNVYIPTHAGYTEIDTVLLHETGIYVFETKNISGAISGSMELREWTQVINERVSHKLYNPVMQNMGHMGALLRQLHVRLESAAVYSFVVFSDRCMLRLAPASGKFGCGDDCWQVLHFGELRNALGKGLARRRSVYTARQLESWWKMLQQCVNVGEKVKNAHRDSVQKKHNH